MDDTPFNSLKSETSDVVSPDAESGRWREYYELRKQAPPRPTLLDALARFDSDPAPTVSRFALDLGCGDGPDTAELLRRGWSVLAMDAQPEAIRRLRERSDIPAGTELETHVVGFESMTLRPATLINASYSLPFCAKAVFPSLWEHIVTSLVPGGRFCGQLFGDHDEWAGGGRTLHYTQAEAKALLSSLIIEKFEEEERDGTVADGSPKHWHAFHIVARKG